MIHPQPGQRAEVLEHTDEERGVVPFADAVESGKVDIGRDPIQGVLGVRVPTVHYALGGEMNAMEEVLLTPFSPSLCDERRAAEAGIWEVANDCVGKLLGY